MIYLVSWDDDGIVKIGATYCQRWRKFTLRGARLAGTWRLTEFGLTKFRMDTYAFERTLHTAALSRWRHAFLCREDAVPFVGGAGQGWSECYKATPDDALAMLEHHATASCDRIMRPHAPPSWSTDGRTDGLTKNRGSAG